ncbi:hypothetical protein BJV82DRAFT_683498 [Fennellomyces sp. T-0311]|nr:hypothetical protein BJV82DRAFT_683498 [Fennellomyces sp. T-0311]
MTNPTLVFCPYCGLPAKKSSIDKHIDECPGRKYIENQASNANGTPGMSSTVPCAETCTDEDTIMLDAPPVNITSDRDSGSQQGGGQPDSPPEFELDYGDDYRSSGNAIETGNTTVVDPMNADSRRRIDDEDDDAASVDSHNEPVESRALPIDNPRGVDDDDDEDNDIENAVGDDNREYERDEENPLHYTFKEYPYIGQDARTRKSCELYCLVQEQNITRATYHRLIRMFNGWMEDDELSMCTP